MSGVYYPAPRHLRPRDHHGCQGSVGVDPSDIGVLQIVSSQPLPCWMKSTIGFGTRGAEPSIRGKPELSARVDLYRLVEADPAKATGTFVVQCWTLGRSRAAGLSFFGAVPDPAVQPVMDRRDALADLTMAVPFALMLAKYPSVAELGGERLTTGCPLGGRGGRFAPGSTRGRPLQPATETGADPAASFRFAAVIRPSWRADPTSTAEAPAPPSLAISSGPVTPPPTTHSTRG